jgi:signal transduction histidine kinase
VIDAFATSSVLAWPLALTLATVVISERTRRRRRRETLNRALHELRRPLQALTLTWPQPVNGGRDHLGLALEALGELDRCVNEDAEGAPTYPELVEARAIAGDAVRRWRGPAAQRGREIGLHWHASGSRLLCDRNAVARALDNLIANSLEHGSGSIRVEGSLRADRLRFAVTDGPAPSSVPSVRSARAGSPRRGHGLRIVAEIAAQHGGRFAASAGHAGGRAVIELPLAGTARAASR